ncbi:FAD-dependent oxidoreductase [Pelotomaculum propionicicum]|uniref:NADH oxidase n=1 Tax=Pelotomaculum propionicicum TaxID=258475 RepID=A0A4Y7RIZ5_9FIRM|nr:FAD-dependent oxidoreductase [Pelotomaculum propionicicum]TEB08710.1 NADH oxidase [Pelotomaculum propionicicum]
MFPKYKEKYPLLFEPLTVGKSKKENERLHLKHRILVSPLFSWNDVDPNGHINQEGIDFYGRLAEGGFASICIPVEIPRNGGHSRTLVIDDEENIAFADMHKLQRYVHAFDTRTMCEIYHAGICMHHDGHIGESYSCSETYWNGNHVREMNEDDMEKVAEEYGRMAKFAKRAGFDAINLHFAHGWLVSNFLSPITNHRKDKYGPQSIENMCRFPLMILDRVRAYIGDMPIELRMNWNDGFYNPEGITLDMCVEQCRILSEKVDMIHITCGQRVDALGRLFQHPTHFVEPGHNLVGSEAVKKAVKIPIGVVGSMHNAELCERALEEGKADYVLMGRQAVADHEFVNKIKEGREEDIRPCIRCDKCLDGGRRGRLTDKLTIDTGNFTYNIPCSVNPFFVQGLEKLKLPAPKSLKKVAVVGGGPGGMMAAVTAAEKGHDVTLFEKTDKLGGQLGTFMDHMWFKNDIKRYVDYMRTQIKKRNVKVIYNTVATPEMVSDGNFDAVIVAVGAEPVIPPIPGVDSKNVVQNLDVFGNEDKLGDKIVLVGGGLIACETAIHLYSKGFRDITILEMGEYLASTGELTERLHTIKMMEDEKIKTYTFTTVNKIDDKGVYATNTDGQDLFFEADSVIISTGMKPLAKERDSFKDTANNVRYIGDCRWVADICDAVDSGFDAAATL